MEKWSFIFTINSGNQSKKDNKKFSFQFSFLKQITK